MKPLHLTCCLGHFSAWVAQATRLSRPATRRTERGLPREPMGAVFSQREPAPFRSAGRRPGRASRPRYPFVRHALSLFVTFQASAQLQTAWVARYNGGYTNGTNRAVAMAMDREGNVVVSGHSALPGGDFDYVAVKYAPNGTQLWAARYGSPGSANDQVRGMALDQDSNVYLTGTSVTVKYNSAGTLQWTAPYGGRALVADTNGYIYLTGFSETNFATAKLHASGTNIWTRIVPTG